MSRKGKVGLLSLPFIVALGFASLPEGRLGCVEPIERETSPDAAWTLTLCRRPLWFAMPGGGSDAPGWIVLRDAQNGIRGVVDLGMIQNYRATAGAETVWAPDRVEVFLVADLPLSPAAGPVTRWLDGQLWRWRSLLGFVPTDDQFR